MAVKPIGMKRTPNPEAFEALAAGTYDLTARSGKPQRCARQVIAVAAGNWTMLKDSGEVDTPPGAVPANFTLTDNVSAITCSAEIMVIW